MGKNIRYRLVFLFVTVLSLSSLAQNGDSPFHLWKPNCVSGELRLNGFYREQERIGRDINEYQKSTFMSGGLMLRTNGSVIHPNFMVLDVSAAYMPETRKENFIVIPDQSEVRTVKKLDVSAHFLQHKKVNINLFGNFDESYSTRENLTDIKTKNQHLGASLGYNNRLLPLTIDFHSRKWDEEEISTKRHYTLDQNIFNARVNRSFSRHDRSELRYSHDENVSVNQNLYRVANTIDNVEFNNNLNFGSEQRLNFNTVVMNHNQHGNIFLKRFQASEYLNVKLPLNLTYFGSYSFYRIQQQFSDLNQNSLVSSLEHQLYKSLRSKLNFEYNSVAHTVYNEKNTKAGVEFNYSKSIPHGQFTLSYKYDRYFQNYNSDPVEITVEREAYTLSDSRIVLLRLANIDINSILVKDETGTIVYLNNVDYILIERNRYIEIRRIPGSPIADNSTVFIDYIAVQPGNYSYAASMQVLNAGVYLFKNKVSLYYRYASQDYSNLKTTEFVTLNYFNQNLAGFRLDFGFLNAGAEYEDYSSSILPYTMKRFYIGAQRNINTKLMLLLNANLQDYIMIEEGGNSRQRFLDVMARLVYPAFRKTYFNFDLMYRNQQGRGIDLDLLTARAEIISNISQMYFSVGAEVYRRNYIGEKINFKGTFVKLVRKF